MAKGRRERLKHIPIASNGPDLIRVSRDGVIEGSYWENLSAFDSRLNDLTPEERESRRIQFDRKGLKGDE